jgi:hypothetical protein
MVIFRATLISLAFMMAGCLAGTKKSEHIVAVSKNSPLEKYLTADAVADVRKAIDAGDFRFLAVRGYTVLVPGVPNFEERFAGKYSYRIIEGTSDTVAGPADRELQMQVRDYAKRYNQTLLGHLSR